MHEVDNVSTTFDRSIVYLSVSLLFFRHYSSISTRLQCMNECENRLWCELKVCISSYASPFNTTETLRLAWRNRTFFYDWYVAKMYVLNVAITHHQIFAIFCHSHYAFIYIEWNENRFVVERNVSAYAMRCDLSHRCVLVCVCMHWHSHWRANYFDRFVEFMSSITKNLCWLCELHALPPHARI